ncbi:MAG: UDP-glucuronate decarboxylase [Patescibacteria group bacterium]|nr:UDP-glucuronate decarboxylase [Patescibacteria group bacterium]
MLADILTADLRAVHENIADKVEVLAGKTILLSGSSGFLGRHFLLNIQYLNAHVLEVPCRVIAIDNAIVGNGADTFGAIIDQNFSHIAADICAPLRLEGPVDYVVHMAGIASPVFYMKYPLETIRAAVHGTENLLEFARVKKVKKFLVFSSSEIYGDPPDHAIPTPETYRGHVSTLGPRACYDESKRMAETLAMTYFSLYQVPVQIIRPFNVYGPGMHAVDRRVIPQFLTCALQGRPLPIHGHGRQTRSYCYISDAIAGFLKVMLEDGVGQVYNIGNPDEISLNALAESVQRHCPGVRVERIDYPAGYPAEEPMRRCPDIAKAKRELGYAPKIQLHEGIGRTLIWFQEHLKPALREAVPVAEVQGKLI